MTMKPQIRKVEKKGNVREKDMWSWKRLLLVRDVHGCMLCRMLDECRRDFIHG